MAARDEFLAHVLELLAPRGRVAARRMFGGDGLYCDGVFFGIVLWTRRTGCSPGREARSPPR